LLPADHRKPTRIIDIAFLRNALTAARLVQRFQFIPAPVNLLEFFIDLL
jgi:hypothetical protein